MWLNINFEDTCMLCASINLTLCKILARMTHCKMMIMMICSIYIIPSQAVPPFPCTVSLIFLALGHFLVLYNFSPTCGLVGLPCWLKGISFPDTEMFLWSPKTMTFIAFPYTVGFYKLVMKVWQHQRTWLNLLNKRKPGSGLLCSI